MSISQRVSMNVMHRVLQAGTHPLAAKKLLKIAVLFVLSAYLASCGGSGGSSGGTSTLPATAGGAGVATDPAALFGLAGFTKCGDEGGTIDLKVKTHLAYGAQNAFVYLFNQLGTVKLDSATFGSDPIFGILGR